LTRAREALQVWTRPRIGLAGVLAVSLGLAVLWLTRFRFGYGTDWDESGYMARGLNDAHALVAGGPLKLLWEYEKQGVEAPLVSLMDVPINAVFGLGVFQSLLLMPILAVLLGLATFALARQLVSEWWALLATLVVAAMPVVSDYSREFVFAVPAALFFTATLWALLRSDRLRRPRWVWAASVFVGFMLLSRTMTVSFLPGIALVALGQLFAIREERKRRALRLLAGAGIATFVAASWFLHNWRGVLDYLRTTGYGKQVGVYGERYPVLSWKFWSKELGLILNQTYLPLGAALAACLLAALALRLAGRRRRTGVSPTLEMLGGPVFALSVAVVEGYVALTSSSNEGTAFALPFLPALVILAVVAVTRLHVGPLQVALASALVLVSIGNLVMKSGSGGPLATARSTSVPSLGTVSVTDGRGLMQVYAVQSGYPISSPDTPLPALQRRWLPFDRELTGWMTRYAATYGERAYVLTANSHQYTNQTWISLADALWYHRFVFALWIGPATPGETVAQYRAALGSHPANFVEITSSDGPAGREFDHVRVEAAATALGFRQVKTFRMPDGYLLWLWWKRVPLERLPP